MNVRFKAPRRGCPGRWLFIARAIRARPWRSGGARRPPTAAQHALYHRPSATGLRAAANTVREWKRLTRNQACGKWGIRRIAKAKLIVDQALAAAVGAKTMIRNATIGFCSFTTFDTAKPPGLSRAAHGVTDIPLTAHGEEEARDLNHASEKISLLAF